MPKSDYRGFLFEKDLIINVAYGELHRSFPTHWHRFTEIILPLSDEMDVTIGNKTYSLSPSQFALIPPRELHSLLFHPNKNLSQMIIQFSSDAIPLIHDFAANRHVFYNKTVINNDDFADFSETPIDILLRIKDYYCSNLSFKDLRISQELIGLFIMLGNYNTQLKAKSANKKNHQKMVLNDKFIDIARYISEHCTQDISLDDAASYAGFSRYHFSRIFKEYFDISFPEYVAKQRIGYAIELLENLDLSILDIALLSGFSSHAAFNRTFKRLMHMTPSKFQRLLNAYDQ
jgi:AraC-type DNA-binding domain-containing proteins